jgi:hypothetical protein
MDFSRINLDWPHVIGAFICSAVIVAVWVWGCVKRGWGQ